VVAYLLKHARAQSGSPAYIRGVYIRGIDRPDDLEHVRLHFGNLDWMELKIVDATSEFLEVLKGQTTMLAKRLAMRGVYRAVLEQEADAWATDFIAQGTLYTDISESGAGLAGARKDQIKQHHNVGLHFTRPELTPLNDCVKDLARNIGHELGVPAILLYRHPFPGPGLIVRIEGEVDANRLATARQADDIYIQELRRSGLYDKVWQAGVVVTASQHTCSKGDEAIGGSLLVYWAVNSVNGFTAQAALLPPEFHARVAQRFTNEIREVGAVAYRISGKPPATIEWG
jgi:GMP synthase (glutamine-hydrolysing)